VKAKKAGLVKRTQISEEKFRVWKKGTIVPLGFVRSYLDGGGDLRESPGRWGGPKKNMGRPQQGFCASRKAETALGKGVRRRKEKVKKTACKRGFGGKEKG